MNEFHVRFEDGKIYAGVMNRKGAEWKSRIDATEEAIAAVRDFLLWLRPEGAEQIGYRWHKNDGGYVSIVLIETDEDDGEDPQYLEKQEADA